MVKNKIAIIGSSGYIANFIKAELSSLGMSDRILNIDQTNEADVLLDLTKPEEFDYQKLDDVEYVIMTAAISGPDKCADDYELCWKINVEGTSCFIKEAIKRECKVIFFSSDAVFGDIPGEVYDERSHTDAKTPYGKMKKAVEDEFKNDSFFKAIRLSYVVSVKDRFVSYCLGCIDKNEVAEIFHPFYRNCVAVSDVVNVVMWLLKNWDDYEPWVLNVAGKELVSRVRIADEINRYLGDKLQYEIISPDKEFYSNRPKITQMQSLYLQKYGILEENIFTIKIQKELEDLKNGN